MFNPFTDREKPWNPYGVAKFDLSDLLLGQQLLYITSPILPCPSPDILGMKEGTKKDGKIVGVAGAVDGPGRMLVEFISLFEFFIGDVCLQNKFIYIFLVFKIKMKAFLGFIFASSFVRHDQL